MIFNYDPILGLQYSCLESLCLIDITEIPNIELNIDEVIELFKKTGISFTNLAVEEVSFGIYSNA